MNLAQDVGSRLHHRGAYLHPDQETIVGELRSLAMANVEQVRAAFPARKMDILAAYGFSPSEQGKPFAYSGGTAIIPIHGMLVNRLNWSSSYATGYDFVRSQLRSALADPDISQIIFDVNSNGGVVSGCAELADEIFESRSVKPSLAVVDASAYSAAFFLGSSAGKVICTPTGGVGSIGVLAMHVDMSGALEQEGFKVTFIHKGAEKVDGNSFEPLSDRARASIERDIGYHYDLFVGAVARNRGVSEDAVRATEARCYLPTEAKEIGLIDGIQTPTGAVSAFGNVSRDGAVMELSENDVRRIAAEAATQAVNADRARVSSIRSHAEAKGRETLADHLAFNTSMSIEEATAVLSASPKPAEEKRTQYPPATGFAGLMDKTQNPNVGADNAAGAEGAGAEETKEVRVARLRANFTALSGRKAVRAA